MKKGNLLKNVVSIFFTIKLLCCCFFLLLVRSVVA